MRHFSFSHQNTIMIPKHDYAEVIDAQQNLIPLLLQWHKNKVATLQHMLTLPEGTIATQTNGEKLPLLGEILLGFRLGIELSLIELGELPIAEIPDTESEVMQ